MQSAVRVPPAAADIRITNLRTHVLSAPLKERFGWALNWTSHRSVKLVEVSTDAGLTGWGEGAAAEEILARQPELLLGRSPFESESIYNELRAEPQNQCRAGAPLGPGLDIALWDLKGKALGVPVSRLLGQQHRTRVKAYLTALYRKDWTNLAAGLTQEALEWKAAGYRAMKTKIGYGLEQDVEIVRALREALGDDVLLAADSNCAYDEGAAAALGRRLEQFHLMWWEEPLLATNLDGYRRLRQSLPMPIAAGETMDADWLAANYVQPKLVDILQPDLENIGLTGARMLTWLCWVNHMRLIPHNWGTAIRTAATLHWASTIPALTPGLYAPEVMFEFDQTEHPFRDAIVKERLCFDPADGSVAVPDGPGLGVTVIPEAVQEFRANGFALT